MCLTPLTLTRYRNINGKMTDAVQVPCSKCPECLARRVSAWSKRLLTEAQNSDSAHFITLTYDTNSVPITKRGYMGLNKRDLQLFFKRIRKIHSTRTTHERSIKYYAVGEYGGKTFRPHYHIIAFNIQLDLLVESLHLKILEHTDYDGKQHIPLQAWKLGTVTFGKVCGASVGYCMKYISKPSRIPIHANDDRPKEFALMSKRLGADYLTPQMIAWHKADLTERLYVNVDQGKKASMPRYYKDRIYTEQERAIIAKHYKLKLEQDEREYYKDYNSQVEYNKALAVKAAFKRLSYNTDKGRL